MKIREFQKGGVKEWIYSYLVMLLIPLVICVAFFIYSYSVTWKETGSSNRVAFEIASSNLDSLFAEIVKLEYNLQTDHNLRQVTEIESPITTQDRYFLSQVIQNNQLYFNSNDVILSYCIFSLSNDIGIYRNAYSDFEGTYEEYGSIYGFSYEEWWEILHSRQKELFIVNPQKNAICCINSLPWRSDELTMNVIFELNLLFFDEILDTMEMLRESGFAIVDFTNQPVLSRNINGIDVAEVLKQLEDKQGYQTVNVNGEKMMVAYIKSNSMDLQYISVIHFSEFWKRAIHLLLYFVVAFLLCISIGLIASYIFAQRKNRIYGTLNRLVNDKIKGAGEGASRGRAIVSAMESIVKEYDTMQKQLVLTAKMKRELILSNILEKKIQPEAVEEILEFSEISLPRGNYAVLLFSFSNFEKIFNTTIKFISASDIKLLESAIISIVQELVSKKFTCEILSLSGRIICIVNFGTLDIEECYSEITEIITKSQSITENEFFVPLTVAISNIHHEMSDIYKAYSEALKVSEYQHVFKTSEAINYRDMVENAGTQYLYSMEDENILINRIRAGNAAEAIQLIDDIYQRNIKNSNGFVDLMKCLMYDLTATVMKAENDLEKGNSLPNLKETLSEINDQTSMFEIKELLKRRIEAICSVASEEKRRKKDDLINQIVEYVQAHYLDQTLNNTEIAEYFHMNSTYLSSFFREKTGMNLLAYIHKMRITKAKELLKGTDLTIEEISHRVGCNNSVALIRLFKKYEGITPKIYREREQ